MEILKPDICVIGGGSAGLSVAAAAAAFGVPVVLVENNKMGGDCLNSGCVPSKALLSAAKHAQTMRSRLNSFSRLNLSASDIASPGRSVGRLAGKFAFIVARAKAYNFLPFSHASPLA